MKCPSLPVNEVLRLETLRSLAILDTASEERFDRLTRMARRMFGVPIALVSLVDAERQWFKSCQGLDASETGRDISFCGHAILGTETFVVRDAALDARFADNPLVTGEPHIRFYAGCPLRISNGCALGTLCIIDREPRHMDDEELTLFEDLAAMVVRELEALQLSTLDELTQISNRRGFTMLAGKSLQQAHRLGQTVSLVYLDMDGFKQINDTFGHDEGDQALRDFSNLINHSFRDADVYARLGGDEFAVLLAGANQAQAAAAIARFHKDLARHNGSGKRGYQLACSEGIVTYDPSTPPDLDGLLKQADSLMYERKVAKRAAKEPVR
ncbi:sensor domain-containing diguanylate cyclase [Aeromonas schubertii]|uniref:Diguanylate cyclase n=1 Tax=Aeromonas schubertii TaxID=652 RepID=A0A0S2SNH5_9GAMM|nr:sensor domain-containing diguanylate cyclase [Aeromonas schubertii]ALP43285.1 diguanylate cyclase [Aeromonas schubertii]KUE79517.1 diguanylate cyclase [Aeromonas schubertii]MBZ6065458.1 sensor domain-containing diguanylate cyclase [Aeromonas schubertii]QCG49189.1 sensor domain-containing diguanylate cyclase [Aeromonas schubertii]